MDNDIGFADIKEIKKFISDENAWYQVILPTGYNCDDMMAAKRILDNSRIEGRFIVTTEDTKITDITEYVKQCMEEHNER